MLEYDTDGFGVGEDGEVRVGKVNKDKYYVYENGAWRASVSEIENNLGACVTSRLSEVSKFGNEYYTCKTSGWVLSTALEYDTYQWTAGTDGEVKPGSVISSNHYTYADGAWRATASDMEYEFGACVASRSDEKHLQDGKYYICENKAWKQITAEEYGLGYCMASNSGVVENLNNVYYICKTESWVTATALEYDTYGWKAGTEGEMKPGSVNSSNHYVYENGAWRASANDVEFENGACVASRDGEKHIQNGTYYICETGNWEEATVLEYDTYGKTCSEDGSIVGGEVVAENKYVCDAGVFRVANEMEISLNKGCVSYTENDVIRKQLSEEQDSIYTCKNSNWTSSVIVYGSLTDERDLKTYKTVAIGTQIWMAENLNYSDTINYPGMIGQNWCSNNDLDSCAKYGRLYTWVAAMDSAGTFSANGKDCGRYGTCSPTYPVRGICPEGWHLPDTTEWITLFRAVGGMTYAGKVLKSQSGWYSNGNGTDAYGFSLLPAGNRSYKCDYYHVGKRALFWSVTQFLENNAYIVILYYSLDEAYMEDESKDNAFSVRCLKN